jgi:hypothetical protein
MYSLNYSSAIMISSIPEVVEGDKCNKIHVSAQGISELTLRLLSASEMGRSDLVHISVNPVNSSVPDQVLTSQEHMRE